MQIAGVQMLMKHLHIFVLERVDCKMISPLVQASTLEL